jgi:transcription-repair coupling factor (superfamily II helicase)
MHIPTDYVESTQERLRLYQDLDNIEDEDRLQAYANGLKDRFGPLPTQVEELFDGLRLRWLCRELGFDRVILKNDKLMCFFVEDSQSLYYDSEIFKALSGVIAEEGQLRGLRLKQSTRRLSMIKERVYNLTAAQDALKSLSKRVDEVLEERKLEKAL